MSRYHWYKKKLLCKCCSLICFHSEQFVSKFNVAVYVFHSKEIKRARGNKIISARGNKKCSSVITASFKGWLSRGRGEGWLDSHQFCKYHLAPKTSSNQHLIEIASPFEPWFTYLQNERTGQNDFSVYRQWAEMIFLALLTMILTSRYQGIKAECYTRHLSTDR